MAKAGIETATTLVCLSICLQQLEDTDCNLRLEQFSFLTVETLHVHWLHTHWRCATQAQTQTQSFQLSTSLFSPATSQQHLRMVFTSHNSSAILEPVANTMTSLTEPGCRLKSCLGRDMFPQRLRSLLQKFYGDLVYRYGISVSQMKTGIDKWVGIDQCVGREQWIKTEQWVGYD